MHELLKASRLEKKMTLQQVADYLRIDAALISRYESGKRLPTKDQILKLATLFQADSDQWLTIWLSLKIKAIIQDESQGISALKMVLDEVNPSIPENHSIENLWAEVEKLKNQIGK